MVLQTWVIVQICPMFAGPVTYSSIPQKGHTFKILCALNWSLWSNTLLVWKASIAYCIMQKFNCFSARHVWWFWWYSTQAITIFIFEDDWMFINSDSYLSRLLLNGYVYTNVGLFYAVWLVIMLYDKAVVYNTL